MGAAKLLAPILGLDEAELAAKLAGDSTWVYIAKRVTPEVWDLVNAENIAGVQPEPVTERKIVRGGEGGYMAVVLQPGMRAMALPVTVETGAGGFILPGDRVDVLQNRRVDNPGGGGGAQETVATVIMRNLRVLAIDQTTEPQKDAKAMVGAVATLEVPAGDEEVMSRAKSQGDLVLALRSYADAGGPSGRGAGGDNTRVRVWRAGQASEVTVAQ